MTDESPISVLVVDDERDIREGASRILAREGLAVRSAASGSEALAAWRAEPSDLILLDLKMPGVDGMEVLRSVRARSQDVLVIVVTGFATLETAVDAMKEGAYDFMPKPFTPDQIRMTVRRAVERIGLRREAARLGAERRRTLRDIATEKSRSRAIIDQMDDGVLVVNRDGDVVLSNPAAAALLGVDRPGVENVPFSRLVQTAACRALVDCACRGDPIPRDRRPLEVCLPDGRALMVKVQPVPREPGAVAEGSSIVPGDSDGAIVVLSDVTEYKRLDRMKSDLVAKVSHEIRSPLASIHQQLAAILYETVHGGSDEQREVVSRARDRARGLITLVSDLLDISRLEAGGGSRSLGRLDAMDAAIAAVEVVRPQAEERRIGVDVRRSGVPAAVYADPRDIETVFVNLLTNAVNYTPPGGHVTVSGTADAEWVVIDVADDGIGIAPEDIDRVFEHFYRVKTAETRHVVGTGLGLPIVRSIVTSYGGSVAVRSTPGAGSTFTVRLPAALPAT